MKSSFYFTIGGKWSNKRTQSSVRNMNYANDIIYTKEIERYNVYY